MSLLAISVKEVSRKKGNRAKDKNTLEAKVNSWDFYTYQSYLVWLRFTIHINKENEKGKKANGQVGLKKSKCLNNYINIQYLSVTFSICCLLFLPVQIFRRHCMSRLMPGLAAHIYKKTLPTKEH